MELQPLIVDLFAGPGGWDHGLALFGIEDLIGVEIDPATCATRQAAGLLTLQADVRTVDPGRFAGDVIDGLIASPPCPGFSANGKRGGMNDFAAILAHLDRCRSGWQPTAGAGPRTGPPVSLFDDDTWYDQRSPLVLEPVRFALALRPEWIALEQVPAVLPIWQAIAELLTEAGWGAWAGMVNAADYGVPQTRQRAVLLARRGPAPVPPTPTHGPGRPRPWRSMAEALDWPEGCSVNTGLDWKPGGSRADAQVVAGDRPAPTVTGKSMSQWWIEPGRRRLSLEAALALQTFPADWPVVGTAAQAGLQVGNAVPPRLAADLLAAVAI